MKIEQINDLIKSNSLTKHEVFRVIKKIYNEADYVKPPMVCKVEGVYRAVKSDKKEWFDSISKFSFPPTHVAKLNRCTWERESALYASSDNAVPFFEIRAKKGEFIALAQWVNKEYHPDSQTVVPIEFNAAILGAEQILSHPNNERGIRELVLKDAYFWENTPERVKKIDRYVGWLFAQRSLEDQGPNNQVNYIKDLYKYTSAVAKTYLEHVWRITKKDRLKFWPLSRKVSNILNGLIYPSVESELSGVNIMLTREFASENLRLAGVALYQVEDYEETSRTYALIPIETLMGPPDKPYWVNVHPNHEGERFIFSPNTPTNEFHKFANLELGDVKRYLNPNDHD